MNTSSGTVSVVLLAFFVQQFCSTSTNDSIIRNSSEPDQLQHITLLHGILSEIVLSESNQCATDANIILNGIQTRYVWALKSMI